jgi:hypothetical protein
VNWPEYRWNPRTRQYHDDRGRFVPRKEVRRALDSAIGKATGRIARNALDLQAGKINLAQWQLNAERELKAIHVMSTALASGGWAQVTTKDWAQAGRLIKAEYAYLARFARELENGLPLDGRFLVRAAMYARAGHGTYETILRRQERESGRVARERRITHSGNSCDPCIGYEAMGWQDPGVLPDTGDDCLCMSNCLCTFEYEYIGEEAEDDEPEEAPLETRSLAAPTRVRQPSRMVQPGEMISPGSVPPSAATRSGR